MFKYVSTKFSGKGNVILLTAHTHSHTKTKRLKLYYLRRWEESIFPQTE